MSIKSLVFRIVSQTSRWYSSEVFYRKIQRALALHWRGEARRDGLVLTAARTRLQVEWIAREVHPWDRDLPLPIAQRRFSEQCLDDTRAAIERLFNQFPMLDSIEICVKRNRSDPPLLSGTVSRRDLDLVNFSSTTMTLHAFGLKFRLEDRELRSREAE